MVRKNRNNKNEKISFGKYKGLYIEDIFHQEQDYSYIVWLYENEVFYVNPSLYRQCKEMENGYDISSYNSTR